jgi:endoglucanase
MKSILQILLACLFGACAIGQENPSTTTSTNERLYVAPNKAAAWLKGNPASPLAPYIQTIAEQAQAITLDSDDLSALTAAVSDAKDDEIISILLYNIKHYRFRQYMPPNLTAEQSLAEWSRSKEKYIKWVNNIASIVGNHHVILVLEPDAIYVANTSSRSEADDRFATLSQATMILKSLPKCEVYIGINKLYEGDYDMDGEVAHLLKKAGVDIADGFCLNAFGYSNNGEVLWRGKRLSERLGNKLFIVDTSRNGAYLDDKPKKDSYWCNPPGRATGRYPTLHGYAPSDYHLRALLWISHPGDSDGKFRGGPETGVFWPEYAARLVNNRPKDGWFP